MTAAACHVGVRPLRRIFFAAAALLACGAVAPDIVNAAAASSICDLALHEQRGGHTLARHVGKSDYELRARLAQEPEIVVASSFDTRAAAEASVCAALHDHAGTVAAWLAGAGSIGQRRMLRLDEHMPYPVGRVMERGGNGAHVTAHVRVILRKRDGNPPGYYILTAYPEP